MPWRVFRSRTAYRILLLAGDLQRHFFRLLLAAGAGALVNARCDRIVGMSSVIAFLDGAESGQIERLRQSCLYSDVQAGKLLLPPEQIQKEQATFFVVLSGEVLAEVAGFEPGEWERLIAKVEDFEKQNWTRK